jgi:ribonuclease-3
MPSELASLEAGLGYRFASLELLRRALTHSSHAHEIHTPPFSAGDHNEQLEFLGDAVLGFLVSEALVHRNPAHREGEISRDKAHLVSAAHLHGVARRLDLGRYLELGRSEEMSGGRSKKTLLADALEAVLAAIYLDGGMEAARGFVTRHILDAPFAGDEEAGTDIQPAIRNFKSALQELAQARKLSQPRYSIVKERGPEHAKLFTVEVRIGKEWVGQADGRTKKVAAQRAARGLYERLMHPPGFSGSEDNPGPQGTETAASAPAPAGSPPEE